MLFKKEKEVVKQIISYIDKAEESLNTGINTVERYINKDIKTAKALARKTGDLESQADLIRHDIRDKLYSGAYMPLLREDICSVLEWIDKVVNAGEFCCDFFLNQRPAIPDDLAPSFLDISKDSFRIIVPLKESILSFIKGDEAIGEIQKNAKTIGLLETTVDNKEWNLTKAIFISSLDYSHKLHLKNCLDAIVRISDRAEKAACQIELVTLKLSG